jgi:hypothetical protein
VTVVELCSLSAVDFKELLVIRPEMLVLIREVCNLYLLGLTDFFKRAVFIFESVCLVIKENQNKEKTRTADSKVDEEKVVRLDKPWGVKLASKLVKRMLRISFSSLVPASKIAKAADQHGIIVAWWPWYGTAPASPPSEAQGHSR